MLHLRSSRRSRRAHSHTCPIGLLCSCVPIYLGRHLVGVAKVVTDQGRSAVDFASAMTVLSLVVSSTCGESTVSTLSDEVRRLRRRLGDLQRIHARTTPDGVSPSTTRDSQRPGDADARAAALVERVLSHLQANYEDPALSLDAVARAVRCNPRYLTSLFTAVVGERMRAHLLALRVAHACRLLIETDLRLKEVAFASGFTGAGRMAVAFKRRIGVSPGDYRRIFSGP